MGIVPFIMSELHKQNIKYRPDKLTG